MKEGTVGWQEGTHFGQCHQGTAVVAEWLRRLTRNQFPSGSVGSNPTGCDMFLVQLPPICDGQNLMLQVRLELTTPAYLVVYCL